MRKKELKTLDREIAALTETMTKTQAKYNAEAEKLRKLQQERRKREAELIVSAYERSEKSFDELMIFLQP